jgi:hypothetical protein
VFPSDLPGVNPAILNGMLLYYRLMTKWSGLGDSTELSRVGLSQERLGFAVLESRCAGVTQATGRWGRRGLKLYFSLPLLNFSVFKYIIFMSDKLISLTCSKTSTYIFEKWE